MHFAFTIRVRERTLENLTAHDLLEVIRDCAAGLAMAQAGEIGIATEPDSNVECHVESV